MITSLETLKNFAWFPYSKRDNLEAVQELSEWFDRGFLAGLSYRDSAAAERYLGQVQQHGNDLQRAYWRGYRLGARSPRSGTDQAKPMNNALEELDQAQQEGRAAGEAGTLLSDNPYSCPTTAREGCLCQAWECAWLKAARTRHSDSTAPTVKLPYSGGDS